jgi:bacterioferritin-associated ferredoxin
MFKSVMFVCCCFGVTDREIHEAIAGGAHTVEAVSQCTRAGSKCGSCRPEIGALLRATGVEPAPSPDSGGPGPAPPRRLRTLAA